MIFWCIYKDPDEFPGEIIARKFLGGIGEVTPTEGLIRVMPGEDVSHLTPHQFECVTLAAIRQQIAAFNPGLICFVREDGDDPTLLETWM